MVIYIVKRGSAMDMDGEELDCFDSFELAQEWAEYIDGTVLEENTIDRDTLNTMKVSYSDDTARQDHA